MLLLACSTPEPAAAVPATPWKFEKLAEGSEITAIVAAPGSDPDAIWVTTQKGRLYEVNDGVATVRLDISARVASGGETGLLGLALSPRADDPRLFVNYTFKDEAGLHSRIAAFAHGPDGAVPDAEQVLLEYDQPWANHNSGAMTFGADGMLYLGVGDGGSGGDPKGTGQRRDDLLGSILRIDVRGQPYRVPPDNPFVGVEGVRPEIWAYGLRNPWGMHADGDEIWFADVGQNLWEEFNLLKKGANYGWNVKEGTHCFKEPSCAGDFVEPVAEYGHDVGRSITGGPRYRGPSIPALDGRVLYADFATGAFWGFKDGKSEALPRLAINPSAFGVDRSGRLLVADYSGGVYRFAPN